MDNYVGEIRLFAGRRAPSGWALCDGSTIQIASNAMLYAIIGNTFGGNATTFNLPDLRGRVPVGSGYRDARYFKLGDQGGVETVTLDSLHVPPHSHKTHVNAYSAASVDNHPKDRILGGGPNIYTADTSSLVQMGGGSVSVGPAGGSAPHTNIMPVQALNYMICVDGLFPDRQ